MLRAAYVGALTSCHAFPLGVADLSNISCDGGFIIETTYFFFCQAEFSCWLMVIAQYYANMLQKKDRKSVV